MKDGAMAVMVCAYCGDHLGSFTQSVTGQIVCENGIACSQRQFAKSRRDSDLHCESCDDPTCRACWRLKQPMLLDVGPSQRPPSPIMPPAPGTLSNEFYTPRPLFNAIEKLLNVSHSVDTCATKESAKCARFFTQEQDGLRQDYRGAWPWTNGTYDNLAPWLELTNRWMSLPLELGAEGWTHCVPNNRSDQDYWRTFVGRFVGLSPDKERIYEPVTMPNGKVLHIAHEVECERRPFTLTAHDIIGRVPFGFPGDPEGRTSSGGSFPSTVLVWRRTP